MINQIQSQSNTDPHDSRRVRREAYLLAPDLQLIDSADIDCSTVSRIQEQGTFNRDNLHRRSVLIDAER